MFHQSLLDDDGKPLIDPESGTWISAAARKKYVKKASETVMLFCEPRKRLNASQLLYMVERTPQVHLRHHIICSLDSNKISQIDRGWRNRNFWYALLRIP